MARDLPRESLGPRLAVGALGLVAAALSLSWHSSTLVSNDGIQYLEGARTLLAGQGFSTGILIYDPNFAAGTLPTSQTTFPPGYPAAIALFMALGFTPALSGLLVSLAGALATAVIVARALGGWLGAVAAAVLLLNLQGAVLVTIVASDVAFTTFATGALVCLAAGLGEGGRRRALWLGGALAAVAFVFRFAGTFLLLAVGLFFAARWLRRPTRGRFVDGLAAVLPGAVAMAALFARNLLLSGDADGGALDAFVRPWGAVLSEFFWGAVTLLGVASAGEPAFLPEALALGGAGLFVAVRAVRARAAASRALGAWSRDPLAALSFVFIVVYLAALLFLSHTRNSIILLPRYLLPLLPPLVLVAGRGLAALSTAGALSRRAAVGVATLGAFGLLLGGWSYWPEVRDIYLLGNPAERAAVLLDAPGPDGPSMREFLNRTVPPAAPLLAEPGHALGFLLGHPTLGPIGSAYSARPWDAAEMRAAVDRYGVDWALHVPGLAPAAHIPSFWAEVEASGPPPWLVPVYTVGDAVLYRVAR